MCVTWPVGQGGRKSTYHAAWLSEFCACPECYDSLAVHYSWTKHFDPMGTTVAEAKVIGGFISHIILPLLVCGIDAIIGLTL